MFKEMFKDLKIQISGKIPDVHRLKDPVLFRWQYSS